MPRSRRGTAAVEFALAAPVLFLFLFGIMEFGRMMLVRNTMANAAREGCRRAVMATTQSSADVENAVRTEVGAVASADDFEVSVSPSALATVESGTSITVDVRVNYADVSWIPVSHLVGDAQLVISSVQVRE